MARPRMVAYKLVALTALATLPLPLLAAEPAQGNVQQVQGIGPVDEERQVTLVLGESTTLKFPRLIKVIDIKHPDLLSARGGRTPDELRITAGDTPGVGQIVVTDEEGRKILVTVRLLPDISQLRSTVELAFPDASVEIHPISDTSVLVTGYVESAETAARLVDTISKYGVEVVNRLTVAAPAQIQLRLVVAEVSRTKLRQLGLNFRTTHTATSFDAESTNVTSSLGFLSALDAVARPINLGGPAGALLQTTGANLVWRVADGNDEWMALLRALKEEGLARLLAEPVLVSNSGRPASFLDGGEFAILVPQPTQSTQITYTVEFRTFGVRLNFLPTVLNDGWIRLQVSAEVSEPDTTLGAAFAGSLVPGLRARRAETTVTLKSGQTLAIAGLLQVREDAQTRKIPVLGDLPVVGAAFRVVESARDEREIVILLTPEVVSGLPKAMAPAYLPGSETQPPTDSQLWLEGKIEQPSSDPVEEQRRELRERGVIGPYRRPGTALPEGIQLGSRASAADEMSGKEVSMPATPQPLSLAGPSGLDEPK